MLGQCRYRAGRSSVSVGRRKHGRCPVTTFLGLSIHVTIVKRVRSAKEGKVGCNNCGAFDSQWLKVPVLAAGPSNAVAPDGSLLTGPVKTVVHAVCARVVPRQSNMRVVPMEVMALALIPPELSSSRWGHTGVYANVSPNELDNFFQIIFRKEIPY
jgi:hypothetical protein